MDDREGESSGVENKLFEVPKSCTFRERKIWRRKIIAKFASRAAMPQKC